MTRPARPAPTSTRIAAAVLAAAMLVLVGCARIPSSGPVLAGESEQQESDQSYSFFPETPTAGMTREEIVEGFLDAGTGTQNDYEVAREYLTDSFRQEWDPNARILVTSSVPEVVDSGSDVIEASYKSAAKVDADGLYSDATVGTTERLEFSLQQNAEGEWRISAAPPGIVLLNQNFRSLFTSYTLYFYDDTLSRLVPDVRWFDAQQQIAMTRIARALVNGPAPWLAEGNVVSAIPTGVSLLGAVTVEGDVADVDFSSSLSSTSPDQYSRMLLQLTESMRDFEAISSVTMSITGVPIDQELPPESDVVVDRQVTSTPLVYKAGELGFLGGANVTASGDTAALQAAIAPLSPQKGAYFADGDVASFVTPNGVFTTPIESPNPVLVDGRGGPLAMSLDSWGYTWSAGTEASGLRVSDVNDKQHSWLEPANVGTTGYRAIAVSRDGARLAVLENSSVGVRVAVMAIEREPGTNRPIALGSPLLLQPGGISPIDLAWVDETSLAVLATGTEGNAEVRVQTVGGTASVNGAVVDGQQITGSNTPAGLRVLDKEHHIYVPKGNRWQQSEAIVDFILTQV